MFVFLWPFGATIPSYIQPANWWTPGSICTYFHKLHITTDELYADGVISMKIIHFVNIIGARSPDASSKLSNYFSLLLSRGFALILLLSMSFMIILHGALALVSLQNKTLGTVTNFQWKKNYFCMWINNIYLECLEITYHHNYGIITETSFSKRIHKKKRLSIIKGLIRGVMVHISISKVTW